jgi:hypothetical protein
MSDEDNKEKKTSFPVPEWVQLRDRATVYVCWVESENQECKPLIPAAIF